MARMLSAGRTKVTVCTVKPAVVAVPTATELNAGIDVSPFLPRQLFTWTTAEPNKEDDTPLSAQFAASVPIEKTYNLGIGLYRQFDDVTGEFDPVGEAAFEAIKNMGDTVWIYARRTAKLSGEERFTRYGDLDVELARDAAPWAATFISNNRDFFSERIGCQVYQPIYGMSLAPLCIRETG